MTFPLSLNIIGNLFLCFSSICLVQNELLLRAAYGSNLAQEFASKITVRIEGATQGSGVLVGKEGDQYIVLTATHVVDSNKEGEEVDIQTHDGRFHRLNSSSIDISGVDMSLVRFKSRQSYRLAKISSKDSVAIGESVYVGGFPLAHSAIQIEAGSLIANGDIKIDSGYQYLYDSTTYSGMSGGPILNSSGELIGIHGRGESSSTAQLYSETLVKTGINRGVPIDYYLNFSGIRDYQPSANPVSSGDYLLMAEKAYSHEAGSQSVELLASRSIEIRPSDLGYIYRGSAKRDLGRHEEALLDFHSALTINPNSFAANQGIASILVGNGNCRKAILYSNKAIELIAGKGTAPRTYVDRFNAAIAYNARAEIRRCQYHDINFWGFGFVPPVGSQPEMMNRKLISNDLKMSFKYLPGYFKTHLLRGDFLLFRGKPSLALPDLSIGIAHLREVVDARKSLPGNNEWLAEALKHRAIARMMASEGREKSQACKDIREALSIKHVSASTLHEIQELVSLCR